VRSRSCLTESPCAALSRDVREEGVSIIHTSPPSPPQPPHNITSRAHRAAHEHLAADHALVLLRELGHRRLAARHRGLDLHPLAICGARFGAGMCVSARARGCGAMHRGRQAHNGVQQVREGRARRTPPATQPYPPMMCSLVPMKAAACAGSENVTNLCTRMTCEHVCRWRGQCSSSPPARLHGATDAAGGSPTMHARTHACLHARTHAHPNPRPPITTMSHSSPLRAGGAGAGGTDRCMACVQGCALARALARMPRAHAPPHRPRTTGCSTRPPSPCWSPGLGRPQSTCTGLVGTLAVTPRANWPAPTAAPPWRTHFPDTSSRGGGPRAGVRADCSPPPPASLPEGTGLGAGTASRLALPAFWGA